MIQRLITFVVILFTSFLFAQKKTLTHADYDLWKNITNVQISNKGKLVVSTIETNTKRGDGYIEIYNTESKTKFTYPNGYQPSISWDENYIVFKKKPAYQLTRKEKKKEIKKENRTKDALLIYDVKANSISDSILRVKTYKMRKKEGGWLVLEKYKKEKDSLSKNTSLAFKQNYVLVYSLKTKQKDTIHQIKDFILPERGNIFYYTLKNKKEKESDIGVFQYNLISGAKTVIDTTKYIYDKLTVYKNGSQFTYLSVTDSTAIDSLKFELYYYKDKRLQKLVDIQGENLRKDWELSKDQTPFFSENGKRFYFFSKPKIVYTKDTTLLKDEIPQVDVWNWQDKLIQPEQKSKFDKLNKKAYLSYYNTETKNYVHIQDDTIDDVIFDDDREQQFILGSTGSPYDVRRSWDFPQTKDYYRIDTSTGKKKLMIKGIGSRPYLSPDGKYALYYDVNTKNWCSVNLNTGQKVNLIKDLEVAFYDEDNDEPALPFPYGFGGFDTEGNALIYDKFDVWKVSLSGNKTPSNIKKTEDKITSSIEHRCWILTIEI